MVRLDERITIHAPIDRCFDLARSVEVHLLGNIHSGEQAVASGGVISGLIGLHERVTWRARHFGVWHSLTSEIVILKSPFHFQDVMVDGPFRSMKHDHYFRSLPGSRTEMKDTFVFAAPLGPLGLLAEALVLRRYMTALLKERNRVIREVAESDDWQKYLAA